MWSKAWWIFQVKKIIQNNSTANLSKIQIYDVFNQSYYQQTLLNLKLIEVLNIIEEINIKQTVRFFNINRSKTNLFQFFFVHFANRCRVNQRDQHLRAALPHHVLQIVRQKFRRVPRAIPGNPPSRVLHVVHLLPDVPDALVVVQVARRSNFRVYFQRGELLGGSDHCDPHRSLLNVRIVVLKFVEF